MLRRVEGSSAPTLRTRNGICRLESSQRFLDVDLSALDGFQDGEAYGVFLRGRLRRFASGIGRGELERAAWPARGERSRFSW